MRSKAPPKNRTFSPLARALGVFSIGLGLAELLAPRRVAKLIGTPRETNLLRLLGLREIASGVGILWQRRPAGALWSRVGGDVIDLGLLGAALASLKTERGRVAAATGAVAGVAALDVYCSLRASKHLGGRHSTVYVEKTLTINRSPQDVYAFWRNFENLPRFMTHLHSVQITDDRHSHWVARGPAGKDVEWDAEIIADRPGELISWRSLEGSDVDNAGSVRFEPALAGRGTTVRVKLAYSPPGGKLGAKLALLFGEAPEKQVAVEMHRFKQLLETGEIARTEGQPAARASSTSKRFDDFVRV